MHAHCLKKKEPNSIELYKTKPPVCLPSKGNPSWLFVSFLLDRFHIRGFQTIFSYKPQ